MIRLTCINENCQYSFEVSEKELQENSAQYKRCFLCNCQLTISKEELSNIVENDIRQKVKSNIDKWVNIYGWDYVIDLIKKYKNYYAVGRLYIEELEKRGFIIK